MKRLIKWLMILISLLLLLIGLITFPLPLPIGLPIMLLGIILLLRHSSDAKRIFLRLSRRYPVLREKIDRLRSKEQSPIDTAEERID